MSKQRKRGGSSAAKAVVAAASMCGLVAALAVESTPSAEAQLQLPPPPPLPDLPPPPPLPDLPPPPPLPDLPAPPPPPEVPEDLRMDLTPPGPIEGEKPVQQGTYIIKADNTRLLGHVKMSLIQQSTPQGPKPALRIDADKAVLTNLSVQFPTAGAGPEGGIWQRTGPGQTTTLTGNFHIVVSSLEVTPRVAGLPLIPLPIDANMAPKELQEAAKKIGLGTPDALSNHLEMTNGTMHTYFVKADTLKLPAGTNIGL
ncbi:hypothetical protein COJE103337_05310 [Corynebacterium jeikeium]|uniref:Putative secreted protein n=2 Tax=Corynebacterium jeikeium TaxID=38289 RepID=Q4JY15_CORJK|nr:hypothetical protein [Corynebacterium jeikeium]WCZ52688.1 hypothetical protein CJEIK_00715 [Corynebacterium jeikeium]CAI36292.1 putative secreted protein [Corynebacterium jeikeium K411]SUY82006.1 putative secreted protein [Corynebacterium jeikeium]SUY84215.1 putative secreted protein [Corynebacterium jeikeium]